jgi:hypothetical protein
MTKRLDLTGQRFGRWLVTGIAEAHPKGRAYWLCRCDCGEVKTVRGSALRGGKAQSCGCRWKETLRTHGSTGSPAWYSWRGMLDRCRRPGHVAWERYGGAGISVCSRWDTQKGGTFENFLADMGPRPDGCTLDRIDNSMGYSPENCRWTTQAEQRRNCSRIRLIPCEGKMLPITDAAAKAGLPRQAVASRLHRGWPLDQLLIPLGATPIPPTHPRFGWDDR